MMDVPEMRCLARFNMFTGNEATETITVTLVVGETLDQNEYMVTARQHNAPDRYQQQWFYKGMQAGEKAMNKALSYMGWGELKNY